jgi:DNA-binding IclR family transcriptional regulator
VAVELTDADEAIVNLLSEGRCTAGYLADETEYSRQHVHNRLTVLLAAEYVRKVHAPTGLYELRADPR